MRQFILSCLILCSLSSQAQSQEEIVLSTIQRNPISTDTQTGMADRIAIEAFRRAGLKAVIRKIPARRALMNANNGMHDGDLARIAGVTKRYPNLLPVPEITWVAEIVAFAKNKQLTTPDWDSLNQRQTAYIRGWVVFEKNVAQTDMVFKVVTPEALFNVLKMDRTELALYEKKMGFGVIDEMQLQDIHSLKPALTIEPIYIYLHKRHKKSIPKIAAAIREMKADGSYEQILRETLGQVLSPEALKEYIELQKSYDESITDLKSD